MRLARIAILLLAVLDGSRTRAAEAPYELAIQRAIREDDRHGLNLSLAWRHAPDQAIGIEWSRYDEGPFGARRDLALRWAAINPEPLWRPSFELGLGRATGARRASALVATVGVGGRWSLTSGEGGPALAAELRYRREERRLPDEGGLIAMIGLSLPFGDRGHGSQAAFQLPP